MIFSAQYAIARPSVTRANQSKLLRILQARRFVFHLQ